MFITKHNLVTGVCVLLLLAAGIARRTYTPSPVQEQKKQEPVDVCATLTGYVQKQCIANIAENQVLEQGNIVREKQLLVAQKVNEAVILLKDADEATAQLDIAIKNRDAVYAIKGEENKQAVAGFTGDRKESLNYLTGRLSNPAVKQ